MSNIADTPRDASRRPGLSRRQFLGRSMAASIAAMTVPTIIPASAWGANNRLSVGMIGMGKMMGGHLNALLGRDDVHVAALCDCEAVRLGVHKARVEEVYAQRYDNGSYTGCDAYGDFRDLTARTDIDAVVISTPDHWHALNALAAIRTGKDVYCEKPLTLTIEESKKLVEETRRYGRVFQTGSQQRSGREFRTACELVRNGRIGKVKEVHVNVGGPPRECFLPAEPTPEGLDWDMWLGPAPWRPYHSDIAPDMDYPGWPNFRAYRDYAGGSMTDFGTHHFDIAQWALGMDHTGPVEVHPPGGDRPHLTYVYANGIPMYRSGQHGHNVTFIGEYGNVYVSRGHIGTDPAHLLDEPIGPNEIRLYNSPGHMQDWLNCIRTRNRPLCDVSIGSRSVNLCHIGNIAYWLNRSLYWDPEVERFVNDDEANRLLHRPMREPWRL